MSFEEHSKTALATCQELPPQVSYKQMIGTWFPGLKIFLSVWALILGVNIMTHEILDCTELQGACENYRRKNRAECKVGSPVTPTDPDCDCSYSIVECYSTTLVDDKPTCVSCDAVAQNFIDFLFWTGSFVVLLGGLLILFAAAEALLVRQELLHKHSLMALAFGDVGFLGGLISTAMRKRNIANSISSLCRDGDQEAMDYAPTTMGNLCTYHWMLEWTVTFCIVLILVSLANLGWSLFGVVVGIPSDFAAFSDSKEEPTRFGASAAPADATTAPADGGNPFDPSGTNDIQVEMR
jgi:hypothetical protein